MYIYVHVYMYVYTHTHTLCLDWLIKGNNIVKNAWSILKDLYAMTFSDWQFRSLMKDGEWMEHILPPILFFRSLKESLFSSSCPAHSSSSFKRIYIVQKLKMPPKNQHFCFPCTAGDRWGRSQYMEPANIVISFAFAFSSLRALLFIYF